MSTKTEDSAVELGLNIDMTDADRLRDWARNIDDGGILLTAWASPSFLVIRLRELADRIETEVREVGELRVMACQLREAFDAGATWVAQVDDPARSRFSMDRGFGKFLSELAETKARGGDPR